MLQPGNSLLICVFRSHLIHVFHCPNQGVPNSPSLACYYKAMVASAAGNASHGNDKYDLYIQRVVDVLLVAIWLYQSHSGRLQSRNLSASALQLSHARWSCGLVGHLILQQLHSSTSAVFLQAFSKSTTHHLTFLLQALSRLANWETVVASHAFHPIWTLAKVQREAFLHLHLGLLWKKLAWCKISFESMYFFFAAQQQLIADFWRGQTSLLHGRPMQVRQTFHVDFSNSTGTGLPSWLLQSYVINISSNALRTWWWFDKTTSCHRVKWLNSKLLLEVL